MNTDTNTRVIDADAHVVECAHTWDFMDPSDQQYRPIPLETREEAGVRLQFWVIDGKVRGFRFPAFSAEELDKRPQQVGRKFADEQEARELGNVDLRIEHMDKTGVDVQVLHNTMFIESGHRSRRGRSGAVQELESLARRHLEARERTAALVVHGADCSACPMLSIRFAGPRKTAPARSCCARSKVSVCLPIRTFIRFMTKRRNSIMRDRHSYCQRQSLAHRFV